MGKRNTAFEGSTLPASDLLEPALSSTCTACRQTIIILGFLLKRTAFCIQLCFMLAQGIAPTILLCASCMFAHPHTMTVSPTIKAESFRIF